MDTSPPFATQCLLFFPSSRRLSAQFVKIINVKGVYSWPGQGAAASGTQAAFKGKILDLCCLMLQPELHVIFKLIKIELDYSFSLLAILSTFQVLSSPVWLMGTLLSSLSITEDSFTPLLWAQGGLVTSGQGPGLVSEMPCM